MGTAAIAETWVARSVAFTSIQYCPTGADAGTDTEIPIRPSDCGTPSEKSSKPGVREIVEPFGREFLSTGKPTTTPFALTP
jgi:hypothetical protein